MIVLRVFAPIGDIEWAPVGMVILVVAFIILLFRRKNKADIDKPVSEEDVFQEKDVLGMDKTSSHVDYEQTTISKNRNLIPIIIIILIGCLAFYQFVYNKPQKVEGAQGGGRGYVESEDEVNPAQPD